MINELHGKHYYMELNIYQEVINVQEAINKSDALKDETFIITKHPTGKWVLYSDAKCGQFRGLKYAAWEKIKRDVYTSRGA